MANNAVYIDQLKDHVGQEVTLQGWLYNSRASGKIQFLILRDGTGLCQCIVEKGKVPDDVFEQLKRLGQESSLALTGTVRADERSVGGHEMAVTGAQVIGTAEGYPITPKAHGVEFLMRHRHLHFRSQRQWCIGKIRHTVIDAIRRYFNDNGFILIDTPIFTTIVGEDQTSLFEVDYFGRTLHLTQTGQLYVESAAMSYGKVYCFGPTFRAEKSKTRRHLMEFWMLEPEVAFAGLDDVMALAEDFLVYVVSRVLDRCKEELKVIERDTSKLEKVQKPFPRVLYKDAVAQLHTLGSDIAHGDDFGGDDETILTEQYDRPIMVHRYPSAVKAFYMEPDPADPSLALCVDVLAPEGYGEIIGGSERIHDHDLLLSRIQEHGLPVEAFQWYLDIRKYGTVKHGGFGIGLERTVAWICGLPHVRETIPYPRMLYKLYP